MFIFLGFGLNFVLKAGRSENFWILALIIGFSMFTGAEALFESVSGFDPGNLVRIVTGAVSGFAIGIMFNLGIIGLFAKGEGDLHRTDS